jgi:hypothetical protein
LADFCAGYLGLQVWFGQVNSSREGSDQAKTHPVRLILQSRYPNLCPRTHSLDRVGKQIVNVPSFVVRLDSQKVSALLGPSQALLLTHLPPTLAHRLCPHVPSRRCPCRPRQAQARRCRRQQGGRRRRGGRGVNCPFALLWNEDLSSFFRGCVEGGVGCHVILYDPNALIYRYVMPLFS